MGDDDFYVRYYTGHKGKFGHEFLEIEFRPSGKLRYANDSHYKNETIIRKEVYVGKQILEELKKIIRDSNVLKCDDTNWPVPNQFGKQELEIILDNEHISFSDTGIDPVVRCRTPHHTSFSPAAAKIGSLLDVSSSKDPEGLRTFYYLVQDIKCLVFALISLHWKINPIG